VDKESSFRAFFQRYHAELARFAYLMTGEPDAADDLAAEALTEVWRYWDRVSAADSSIAYARGVVANLARNRVRRLTRERRGLAKIAARWRDNEPARQGDLPAVLDVRDALSRLPHRRRACVVLRYGFGLSERETAHVLKIAVGTVKSQTSRGAAQLAELLTELPADLPAEVPAQLPAELPAARKVSAAEELGGPRQLREEQSNATGRRTDAAHELAG
jgi:RNA polymerase sigma-70 factor (sigma-E family)